jgi:hypothetical protein
MGISRYRKSTTALRLLTVVSTMSMAAGIATAQTLCRSGSGYGISGAPIECILDYGASGRITDAVTGSPIANASVMLCAEGRGCTFGESDSEGSYDMEGSIETSCLPDYLVQVTVRADGYYPETGGNYYSSVVFRHIDLELDRLLTGDCRQRRRVDVYDLVIGVSVLLGRLPVSSCPALDSNLDGRAEVNEVVEAVRTALTAP